MLRYPLANSELGFPVARPARSSLNNCFAFLGASHAHTKIIGA